MKLYIIFAVILLLGFVGLMIIHERVHVEIFAIHGIESHVEYFSHFPYVVTIPEQNCPNEACVLAHNINEEISYPLDILYSVFGIALLIIIYIIELNNYGGEK